MRVSFRPNAFVATLFNSRDVSDHTSNIINDSIQYSMRRAIASDLATAILAELEAAVKYSAGELKTPHLNVANFIPSEIYNRVCLMLKYDISYNVVGNAGIEELLFEIGMQVKGKIFNKGFLIYHTDYDPIYNTAYAEQRL